MEVRSSSPNTGCFSCQWLLLDTTSSSSKFYSDKFNSLKAHAHYFTVLIYLATWQAAKFGIFTYFMPKNLPWCCINSLMYQSINSLIFPCVWIQYLYLERECLKKPFFTIKVQELKKNNTICKNDIFPLFSILISLDSKLFIVNK